MSSYLDSEAFPVANKKAVVVGGGLIGASWAALFIANKMKVTVSDTNPDIADSVEPYVINALADLKQLGLNHNDGAAESIDSWLAYESDLAKAVIDSDIIQESGPENVEIKKTLWQIIEQHAPAHTLLLSSTSGIVASLQNVTMQNSGRLIVGHPFNPPHLLPLVEVVPSPQTPDTLIHQAVAFYTALAKTPVLLKKESKLFVANRLQMATMRECLYLIKEGITTAEDLDTVMTHSLGVRWAAVGPFLSNHLGGGEGGIACFLDKFAKAASQNWDEMAKTAVAYDDDSIQLLIEQVDSAYGQHSISELEKQRDEKQIAILRLLQSIASDR